MCLLRCPFFWCLCHGEDESMLLLLLISKFFNSLPLSIFCIDSQKKCCLACMLFCFCWRVWWIFVSVRHTFVLIRIWTSKVIYADCGETIYWCIFHKQNRIHPLICCVVLCIWPRFVNILYARRINYIPVRTQKASTIVLFNFIDMYVLISTEGWLLKWFHV